MTIDDSYFWEGVTIGQAGPYSSAQFAEYTDQAIATGYDGVVHFAENELSVLASSPASKVVNVSTGSAIVRGRVGVNSAITPFTIADNTSGDPRIDAVVVRVTYATQTVALAVLQGSPAAIPATPALTQSASVWEVYLASIAVANGFTSISQANITDLRSYTNGLYQYISVLPASGFVGINRPTPLYRLDVNGSLGLYEAGSRIIIEGSNATQINRTFLQTVTTNSNTFVGALPNGTATQASFAAYNNATPTNSGVGTFGSNATYGAFVNSTISGSGTQLPFGILIGGSEKVRVDINGNTGFGNTPSGSYKVEVTGTILATSNITSAAGVYATGGPVVSSGTTAILRIQETDGATDGKFTEWYQDGSIFTGRFVNDAYSLVSTFMRVTRQSASYLADTVTFPEKLTATLDDATTNAVTNVVTIGKNTTGTPAAGLGVGLQFMVETSTTVDTLAARLTASWATVTHASRVGELKLYASDSGGERLGITISGSGSAALVGLYSATPVIRYATTGTTNGFTANISTPVLVDSTFTGDTGATAYTIGDIVRALKLLGAMTA